MVLLGLLFAGCKSGLPSNGDPSTADDFCTQYAAAICQVAATCGASTASCEAYQQAQCLTMAGQATSGGAGLRHYTSQNVPDCISRLKAAYGGAAPVTPSTMASINLACQYVYQGTLGLLGGSCSSQFDCAGPTDGTIVCDPNSNRCAIAKTVGGGQPCTNPGDVCAADFYCAVSTQCTADGTSAAASACTEVLPCDSSSHCVYVVNGQYQSPGVCMPLAGKGELCEWDKDCSAAAPTCNIYVNPPACDVGLQFGPGAPACASVTGPSVGTGGAGGGQAGASGSGGTGSGGTGGTGSGGTGGTGGISDTVSCAGQASGTWISMSKTNAPPASQGAGLFWTGTELYNYPSYGPTTAAALYTPCADTWRASLKPTTVHPPFVVPVVSANELLFLGPTYSPLVFAGFDYRQNQQVNPSATGAIPASFTTVVTTGSKMIEWGGAIQRNPNDAGSGFDGTQAGAVYDPARDTWSPTTNSGAPSARLAPGVWTGVSFAVWGGHSGDTYMKNGYQYDCAEYPDDAGCAEYGDGALYDPARDAWTPIAATGAPLPRFNHVLAWTGDRLLVWGGVRKDTTTGTLKENLPEVPFIDGGLYDPAAKAWTPVAASPVPATMAMMSGYYVVWTGDRLAVGQNNSATGWLYDPRGDTWSAWPDGFSGCSAPLAQAGALVALCSVGTPASPVAKLLLPGETAWRVFPLPTGIAGSPSVLWTGKHLFLWGGVFPAPPPPMCPPGLGCDPPAPVYSNAGFMLVP
jgi:hypothetical protein